MIRHLGPSARRRGTAMIEFALLLPFLMMILVLTVFFSHAMMRKQQVIATDRHYTWRHAKRLPDPVTGNNNIDYTLINQRHFNGEPISITLDQRGRTPDEDREGLVAASFTRSSEAGRFAQDVIFGHFPGDVSYYVDATYPRESIMLDQFGRQIADLHLREGVPWQHRHVSIWNQVRDHWIAEFDLRMRNAGQSNNAQMVHVVRNLYLAHW